MNTTHEPAHTRHFTEMEAVASVLDAEHGQYIEALWRELEHEFAVAGNYVTPVAHLSYHVAAHYNQQRLPAMLEEFACTQIPFSIKTSGLGIFTWESPVLYVSVVRTPALADFQQRLWTCLTPLALEIRPYYAPDLWVPHITLTQSKFPSTTFAKIIEQFSRRDFTWEIPIDNVALICDLCGEKGIYSQYKFGNPLE